MKEQQTVDLALENLYKDTGVTGTWKVRKDIDGELTLNFDNRKLHYFAEVKREVRLHQLKQLLNYRERFGKVILIAERIFPNVKKELRDLKFPYLEANGNLFIKNDQQWFWIDKNPPIQVKKAKGNRAFTQTGLKVLFHLILDKNLINQPQREIAEITDVALGNIPQVIDGLIETGYLLKLDQTKYVWDDRKELVDRWITEYATRLKPKLLRGRYKLTQDWKDIRLNTQFTVWGGEPAGNLLTKYLRPEEFTLYTQETKLEVMRHYKLMPENNGELMVCDWFWNETYQVKAQPLAAPPLLVYADLMIKDEKRCRETAQLIFDEYLRPNL